jgi:hypothetical protein
MPGTMRSASGIVSAPERRNVSRVSTATAAAASRSGSSRRDTDVISTPMSSSTLICLSASSELDSELLAMADSGKAAAPPIMQRSANLRNRLGAIGSALPAR